MKKLRQIIFGYIIAILQFILSINLVWHFRIALSDYKNRISGGYFFILKFLFIVWIFYIIISIPKWILKISNKIIEKGERI